MAASRAEFVHVDVTFREARQHAMQAFERPYLLGQLCRDIRPPLRRSAARRSSVP